MTRPGGARTPNSPSLSTFSIVAYDPALPEWGVAVQSRFLAVGAIVPWARFGAGAVATQAHGNVSFGPQGLSLMGQGFSAQETLEQLLATDGERESRQVGLVDAQGATASFTGAECRPWAGSLRGKYYSVQGNLLHGRATLEAMAQAFEDGAGELADRLVSSLAAGQQAGGDRRGQQAAALLVVRAQGSYGQDDDRHVDLRVDDAPQPIAQLQTLLDLHHLLYVPPEPDDWMSVEGKLARDLQRVLRHTGWYAGPVTGSFDRPMGQALASLMAAENLEERFSEDEGLIDRRAVTMLLRRYEGDLFTSASSP
jgi:uncharacterized Ntn-hydrolase superfamily protein